ncbi:sarcosine oxidase subunit delta [Aurantimonas aggregata]|uniref:Sarcosine oxidase subunit delta n=1 Tax=Aurantimonas aggregata TaxID=2047720 RepID=A0A6L9MDL3_9HYPH|nr:sarcosine oxidase subunit delta [Aurantimonas aggregata]NDV85837.1 sarcosine oxidase subunit delta [Aurantimonas aggregata]
MLLIHCPYCEDDRPELEFRHAGEAHVSRPSQTVEPGRAVAEALYLRTNTRGVVFERWRHVHGCGRFFNAARHSVSDAFLAFYKAGEKRPDIAPDETGPVAGPSNPEPRP